MLAAIEYGIENIRRFHAEQMPERMWLDEVRPGAFAGDRFTAIPSVACYVPRGKGSFPSVLMMTTVPAAVAGVPRIVVLTPPGPDGTVDAASLVAARLAGVERGLQVRRRPGGRGGRPRHRKACRAAIRSSAPAAPTSWPPSAFWQT